MLTCSFCPCLPQYSDSFRRHDARLFVVDRVFYPFLMNTVQTVDALYCLEKLSWGLIDVKVTLDGCVYSKLNDWLACFDFKSAIMFFSLHFLYFYYVIESRTDTKSTLWGADSVSSGRIMYFGASRYSFGAELWRFVAPRITGKIHLYAMSLCFKVNSKGADTFGCWLWLLPVSSFQILNCQSTTRQKYRLGP